MVTRRIKKAISDSSDDSSSEDIPDEIPLYDQLALLNKPSKGPSPVKVLPSPRRSPRHAPNPFTDKPSGSAAPRTLTNTAAKRKLQSEEKADVSAKKARPNVPTSTEEQKYDFKFMIDVIDSAAYDAKSDDITSLGLPDDVTEMVMKHFIELRKISKKLNKAVKDKQAVEKMRSEAKTESERKDLNKEIVELTKVLSVMRNEKIDWHSRLHMEIAQLCDRRNEEIDRKADLARRRIQEEKCQKARARNSNPKANKDRRLQNIATDPTPLDTHVLLQQVPPSPPHEDELM
jgi:hypothetical protein